MGNKNDDIDVEKIMQDIRERIKDRNYDDVKSFSEISDESILNDLDEEEYSIEQFTYSMEQTHMCGNAMRVYDEVKGNAVSKGIKRVIRKSINHIFKPFAEAQINYNKNVLNVLDQIYLRFKDESAIKKQTSDKILMEESAKEDNTKSELVDKIRLLEKRVSELEKELKK